MPLKPGTVYVYELNIPGSMKGTDTIFVTPEAEITACRGAQF